MVFKSSSHISIFLVMSILVVVLTVCFLLNSTLYADVDDENLVREFQELFSEFLPKPKPDRPLKHARDTSKEKQSANSKQERSAERPKLLPLFKCNYYNEADRLCVHIRQLGTTLTVGVRVADAKVESPVHWFRVFKVRGQKKSLSFVKFSRGNLPWNINLGGEDNELRISPITETDFSYNFFVATLDEGGVPEDFQGNSNEHLQLMVFRIEPMDIDMGSLYHGEEITINVRSHMELPGQSIQYEWAGIGPHFESRQNLPSNMKLSRDGSAIIIKEHRNFRNMVLTCAVYSNKNFTLGRRNFYLKKIVLVDNPHFTAGNEVRRKQRYLDDFYAQPNWNIGHPSKIKRNSFDGGSELEAEEEAQTTDDLSDQYPLDDFADPQQEATSQFTIIDNTEETVLNFYGNPSPETFVSDTEIPEFENGKEEEQESLGGLIEQANSIVESDEEDKEEQREYTTVKITAAQEKPTFEDKEAMLIADCSEDADCGINAVCFHVERTQKFCKCLQHYRGNGMFCWLF